MIVLSVNYCCSVTYTTLANRKLALCNSLAYFFSYPLLYNFSYNLLTVLIVTLNHIYLSRSFLLAFFCKAKRCNTFSILLAFSVVLDNYSSNPAILHLTFFPHSYQFHSNVSWCNYVKSTTRTITKICPI